jgi:TolB-like protein/Flp pilus assembly protein TadD
MSPEQARGALIDTRTDIWSLGVILYEMVARRLPFWGNTAADVIAAVLERQPPPLPPNSSVALESLERIVCKALQKEQENRYQTAAELLTDLKQLKQKLEQAGEPERSDPQKSPAVLRTGMIGAQPKTESSLRERTSGERGTTPSSAEYVVGRIKHHKYAVLVVLVAVMTAGVFLVYRSLLANKSQPIESIAVMPFTNESGNADIEYLSDGMTDSLINSLSQLPHLSVKSRSSVFRYKGKEVEPQRIASELSVQAILNGRVVQHGDDLTLYLSLVEARNGNQIWGEQYNRKLTDLVVLQQEISREVSEKLRLKLTGEEQRRVARRYTDSSEAYELYLKGQYFSSNPSETNLKKSIEYFQQAIDKDPNYALAYAGIGTACQALGGFLGFVSPSETAPQGKAAIMKALSIDETLDNAHATLAQFTLTYDWNLPEAEREYKRAFELNPNNPAAHSGYGTYLEALGRFDEAVAERERSRQLDPVSAFSTADVGYPLYYARRYDRALDYFQKGLELDPNLSWGHLWIGQVYVQQGRYDEAIAEINRAIALSGGNVRDIATLGHAYAVSGRRDEALKVLGELQGQAKQKYVSPYFIALIYTGLGEREQAFAWLEKAYVQRHPYLILIKAEPVFDSLRSDARFAELMRKVGLPQ